MYYQVISQCTQSLKNLGDLSRQGLSRHAAAKKFDVGVLMTRPPRALTCSISSYQVPKRLRLCQSRGLPGSQGQDRRPKHEDNEQTIGRTARPASGRPSAFCGEREGGAVRGRERSQGQTLLGRPGKVIGGEDYLLPDDDPQHLFPPSRWPTPSSATTAVDVGQDGFSWSYQSGSTPDRSRCAIQTARNMGQMSC